MILGKYISGLHKVQVVSFTQDKIKSKCRNTGSLFQVVVHLYTFVNSFF